MNTITHLIRVRYIPYLQTGPRIGPDRLSRVNSDNVLCQHAGLEEGLLICVQPLIAADVQTLTSLETDRLLSPI